MLERAARCLTNTQQLPTFNLATTVRNRRSLHFAFWHHGAGDLDIPTWCLHTVKALFEPEHLNCGGNILTVTHHNGHRSGPCQAALLDFIYPPRAQTVLKRLSAVALRTWHRNMRRWACDATLRHFASSALKQADDDAQPSKDTCIDAVLNQSRSGKESPIPAQLQTDALRILEGFLDANDRGEYTGSWKEAWDLFGRMDEKAKTPQLIRRLAALLTTSTRPLDLRRAVRLFKTLSAEEKTGAIYSLIIQTSLRLEEYGQAVYFHDKLLGADFEFLSMQSARVLIGHLLAHSQWQLAFHVFKSSMSFLDLKGQPSEAWSIDLFKMLVEMPAITNKVMAFLFILDQYPYILDGPDGNTKKSFTLRLVLSVVERGKSFGIRQNVRAIQILKSLGLTRRNMYEETIMRTLELESSTMSSRKDSAFRIFELYRTEVVFRPSKRILRSLLDQAVKCNDQSAVLELLPEWRSFYGKLPKELTGLLMAGQSRGANISAIRDLLSEHFEDSSGEQDLRLIYPLLHAHALRADPASVEQEFERIEKDFDTRPDIVCWNILLHAYTRAEDLDGALFTLSRLLQSGMKPDRWTFGTVMAICADRGDVDFCEQLLEMSRSQNVPRSVLMNECLVLAYLNDDRIREAVSLARKLTVESRASVTTRLWNQILTFYALGLRPRNLGDTISTAQIMQKYRIPFDAHTYAAIMRAYALKRRTDVARTILYRVLRKRSTPILALHYAIVMDGYANQMKIEKGLRIHADMLARGIKPTISTRLALERLHAKAGELKFRIDRSTHPGLRLDLVDETLEESITAHDPAAIADRTPQLQSARFSALDRYPAAYFDTPLLFYSKIRAYDTVKTLLEKYEAISNTMPLRFTALLMKIRYREGDHEGVAQLWDLAKNAGLKAAKIASNARGVIYLPTSRRRILSRHLDVLLHSLDARGGSDAQKNILAAVNDMFTMGFDLDNGNWNLYVQLLARRGHHFSAFTLCERHLMRQFSGWKENETRTQYFLATDLKSPGTEFLGPRYTYVRAGELRVTFKTMVRFALVVKKLRRRAPFDVEAARELGELEKDAPKTMKALLQMPMKEHPIATHILGKRAARGMRRRLHG